MNWQRAIRKSLRTYNDVKAVAKGRVGKRIGRRVYGKITGRGARAFD